MTYAGCFSLLNLTCAHSRMLSSTTPMKAQKSPPPSSSSAGSAAPVTAGAALEFAPLLLEEKSLLVFVSTAAAWASIRLLLLSIHRSNLGRPYP